MRSTAPRPRRLRRHLLVLTLGTLLPFVVFGVLATALAAMREREVFERGALERTRAVLTAVDAELAGHIASLSLLTKSRELEAQNLRNFEDEVRRTVTSQPYWRGVHLALPSGERVFDTTVEPGADLPDVLERTSFLRSVHEGRPVVSDLVDYGGAQRFVVRVPILDEGRTRYVLSAVVDPGSIFVLLARQRVPADWVLVVVDGQHRVVSRTTNHDATFGKPASASLRDALSTGSEGWFQGVTLEGAPVYTPFARSTTFPWSVAFGIPSKYVEAGVERARWMLGIGAAIAAMLAVVLATALSRRISRPIASLVTQAKALGRGEPLPETRAEDVLEVQDVSRALLASAAAVREREEALRAADRAKDEFLAMLGHELRNPLSALSAASQVLQVAPPGAEPARESAAIVARQVQHMTRLVDDLLDVSRVTTGKISLALEPLDLARTTRNVIEALRAAERLNDHTLEVDARPAWIEADEARIEQIASNLVGNALKYTPPGGRIVVRVAREGGEAMLEVRDTGVGLSPELVGRVFELFVQGERTLDRRLGGLGIGLTLVRRLAELHGGNARARSDGPGSGSTFTVRFPAIEPPAIAGSVPGERVATGARRRILLVEDNDDARRTLRAALELFDFEVLEAADGHAGLALASAREPEAAVIDIGLPGIDGYELCRRLRATRHGAAMLVVALTGYGQPEARRRAAEVGFDEYLTKPAAPDALARLLAEGLAERAASGGFPTV